MRRRLTVALLALVAGALVLAGVGTSLLVQASARRQATADLVQEAQTIAGSARDLHHPEVLRVVRRVLRLEDAKVVAVSLSGEIRTTLPGGLATTDLDTSALLGGLTVSGVVGDVAYAAAPINPTLSERVQLHIGAHAVVVLTRHVGSLGPSWVYFAVVGTATLVVAAAVAWRLGVRVSRPLERAAVTTGQIAQGDLSARVPVSRRDWPELASLSGSINSMAARLARSRQNERELLVSVTHDLRTPLTSIRGYAEAIADGATPDPARAAGVIVAEAGRLDRLVGDLMDLARLRMHRLAFDLRPVDVVPVVGGVVDAFRPVAAGQGLSIVAEIPDGYWPVAMADRDRLAQVLDNLVQNAAGFARHSITVSVPRYPLPTGGTVLPTGGTVLPTGGSVPVVGGTVPVVGGTVLPTGGTVLPTGGSVPVVGGTVSGPVVVEVADDGPGIPPEEQVRVFERFHQVDHVPGRRLGSGVGLAIVAELVAGMGGSVRVVSPTLPAAPGAGPPAHGTRMVVALPPARAPRAGGPGPTGGAG